MESGFNFPGGANDMADQKTNKSKWYTRWYVWLLPAAVLLGVLIFGGS